MAFIDGTALSVALPALQADLRTTGANLLWVTNAFSLPLAALLLFGGALGDCFGRRRIFMLGIVIFTGASLACGLSATVETLIAARVVQGIGGALMIPGSLAMISSFFPEAQRGKAIGAWSAFSVLATTIGPIFGGMLASAGFWRGVFFINLPLAAVSLAILTFKIPRDAPRSQRTKIDGWGALSVTVGLAGLNFGFVRWSALSFGEPTVWISLLIGVTALVAFFLIQLRVEHPLLPLDVFKSRALTGTCLLSFLFYMGFHGTLFFLPLNLIQVQGYSATMAGLTQVPLMVLLVILSAWAGRLVDRRGPRLPLTLGPVLAGAGFLLLAYPGVTVGPPAFWSSFLPGILLIGVGLGLTAAPLSTTIMLSVDAHRLGLASGINSSVTRLAGVFAIAILGPVMLAWFSHSVQVNAIQLELPAAAVEQLKLESAKLAAAEIPTGLSAEMTTRVGQLIKESFVDAFRWIVGIAAGLSWLGAMLAAWLLPSRARALRQSRHE
jgi:EmrB/QacA subfamily drug resistance transporter